MTSYIQSLLAHTIVHSLKPELSLLMTVQSGHSLLLFYRKQAAGKFSFHLIGYIVADEPTTTLNFDLFHLTCLLDEDTSTRQSVIHIYIADYTGPISSATSVFVELCAVRSSSTRQTR